MDNNILRSVDRFNLMEEKFGGFFASPIVCNSPEIGWMVGFYPFREVTIGALFSEKRIIIILGAKTSLKECDKIQKMVSIIPGIVHIFLWGESIPKEDGVVNLAKLLRIAQRNLPLSNLLKNF